MKINTTGAKEQTKLQENHHFVAELHPSRIAETCNLILIVIHRTHQVSSFHLHWATASLIFMICAQRMNLGIKLKLFRSQH